MAEAKRVPLPQGMSCGSCGMKIAAPYRGKPCLLEGCELVIFCSRGCELAYKALERRA